jgi:phenylpropionate dioxygenase-like ring-hydroxylating dioxygenase large terminal subunit
MAAITREQNELLTRTGPGTPMGTLFRQYWLPALLSDRIPDPDGPPIALKLLGERLVAFRDTGGKVGILEELCPHRQASLVFGRNEENGLRCVYHGWKFATDGTLVDTPAERNAAFARTIKQRAYPTHEAGGIVWVYMGPPDQKPPIPEFEFTRLKPFQSLGFHYNQDCNYLQGMEADLDVAHPSFLHSTINQAPIDERRAAMAHDKQPLTYVQEDWFGLQTVWHWKTADASKHLFWVDPYIAPCFTITPSGRTKHRWVWHAWVPIDDENHWAFYVHYDRDAQVDPEERGRIEKAFGHDQIDPSDEWRPRGNTRNMYFLDREKQRRESYTGIRGIAMQDIAITRSMGPIVDRTRENLGQGDALVARLRRYLLQRLEQISNSPAGDGTMNGNSTTRHSYADIDTRMVIAKAGTSYQEVLAHREWIWGDYT